MTRHVERVARLEAPMTLCSIPRFSPNDNTDGRKRLGVRLSIAWLGNLTRFKSEPCLDLLEFRQRAFSQLNPSLARFYATGWAVSRRRLVARSQQLVY